MTAYTVWDEPVASPRRQTLQLPYPASQPGRWQPRPDSGTTETDSMKITHPDSWFFLRALLPAPFRNMDLRLERIQTEEGRRLPKTPGLRDRSGRVIFLAPTEGPMPPETKDWIETAALERLRGEAPLGPVAVSRAAAPATFLLFQILDGEALEFLEKTLDSTTRRHEKPLVRLLHLRERVWRQKSGDYLASRARQPRLCGPGELLGWLCYSDRELFLRRLNAQLGLRGLRSLFYSHGQNHKGGASLIPDRWTSFSLLLDTLPPEAATAWRWLRGQPDPNQPELVERHRRLWSEWMGSRHWLEGFSPAFFEVWEALIAAPLEKKWRDAILELDGGPDITPELRRLGPPEAETFLRQFSHKDLARIFWGREGAWRRLRHLVSRKHETIVLEEMGYLDREASRREPDWAAVYRAKLRWALNAQDAGFASSPKAP